MKKVISKLMFLYHLFFIDVGPAKKHAGQASYYLNRMLRHYSTMPDQSPGDIQRRQDLATVIVLLDSAIRLMAGKKTCRDNSIVSFPRAESGYKISYSINKDGTSEIEDIYISR